MSGQTTIVLAMGFHDIPNDDCRLLLYSDKAQMNWEGHVQQKFTRAWKHGGAELTVAKDLSRRKFTWHAKAQKYLCIIHNVSLAKHLTRPLTSSILVATTRWDGLGFRPKVSLVKWASLPQTVVYLNIEDQISKQTQTWKLLSIWTYQRGKWLKWKINLNIRLISLPWHLTGKSMKAKKNKLAVL